MQVRAIFEAACNVAKDGVKVFPEIMIPLVGTLKELANQVAIVRRVAAEVFAEKERKVEYLVGTMIELPRAALVADEIAKEAEFFSFGTNDLTQTTFGFSRDDINKFLPTYLGEGILKQDPFAVLDREGVGQLVRMGTGKRPQDRAEAEGWHLRRARRRAIVGGVLLPGRHELCFVLSVPRVDSAVGGSTGGVLEGALGSRSGKNEVSDSWLVFRKARRKCRAFFIWADIPTHPKQDVWGTRSVSVYCGFDVAMFMKLSTSSCIFFSIGAFK